MRISWKTRLLDAAIATFWAFGIAGILFFTFEIGAGFGELNCRLQSQQAVKP